MGNDWPTCDHGDCFVPYAHILDVNGWFVHACKTHAKHAVAKQGAKVMSNTPACKALKTAIADG